MDGSLIDDLIETIRSIKIMEEGTKNDAEGDQHFRKSVVNMLKNLEYAEKTPEFQLHDSLDELTLAYVGDNHVAAFEHLKAHVKFCCPTAEAAAIWGYGIGRQQKEAN